jgi:hypothetical protein
LAEEAQRKKLGKKESAQRRFRRVRAATNAPRVGSAVAFEKATQNFQTDNAHLTDKSKFEN